MKAVNITKINPYHAIDKETGLILNQNGDVTKMYRLHMPSAFTQSEGDLRGMLSELTDRFNTLPVNTVVDFTGLYYTSKYESDFSQATTFTKASDLKYWHRKEILNAELYLSITFSERKAKPFQGAVKSSLFSAADYFFSNKPFKSVDKIGKYIKEFESFESMFNSIEKIEITSCRPDEILSVIHKFWTFDFDASPTDVISHKIPNVDIQKSGFEVGDRSYKVVSMIKEGSDIASGMMNPGLVTDKGKYGTFDKVRLPVSYAFPIGLGLPFDHILKISFEIIDNDTAASAINAAASPLKLIRLVSPHAKVMIDSFETYKSLLFEEDMKAVNIGVNVILSHSDHDVLDNMVNNTKSAFTKMNGAQPLVESLESFPAFMYSLPGNRKDWERNHLSITEIASCYFPKETHHHEDPDGFYFLDRSGKPVKVNFWYSDLVTNVNQVIIGPSGSGKSFMMNGLIHKASTANYVTIIIDVGHSYKDTCADLKGMYLDSDDKETLGVNIFSFEGIGDDKAQNEQLNDRKNLVYAALKMIWRGDEAVNQNERQMLKDMISKFYETAGAEKSASGFMKFVKKMDKALDKDHKLRRFFDFDAFIHVFEPFVSGDYQWVFKDNNISLDSQDLIVFSLASISKDELLYPIYTLIVVDQIMSKIKNLPLSTRKSIHMDEAWSIFKGDMVEVVEYLYRTIRKENGQTTVITQSANDIAQSAISDVIKTNTDIKILLKHKNLDETSQQVLRKSLGLTSKDIGLLASLESSKRGREFFVKFGSEPFVFINENSNESNLVYTTNADEMSALSALREKTGSMEGAINEYIELNQN